MGAAFSAALEGDGWRVDGVVSANVKKVVTIVANRFRDKSTVAFDKQGGFAFVTAMSGGAHASAPDRPIKISVKTIAFSKHKLNFTKTMRVPMGVHGDVLKMAATEEKRERIKWYHARRAFFDQRLFDHGLALARQSEHEDARLLVSLFPSGPPSTREEAAARFLACQDDARCLCWASHFCDSEMELLERSAAAGYAWAQALYGRMLSGRSRDAEKRQWIEKAVAQGERDAMATLADWLWKSTNGVAGDEVRKLNLWRDAAELGHKEAQLCYANTCFAKDSLEQFQWLRRSAVQLCERNAKLMLCRAVVPQLHLMEQCGRGRIVFEIGAALSAINDPGLFEDGSEKARAAQRVVSLYLQWNAAAKKAILCWIWMARELGVARDIRLMIADCIWDDRAAWSE